MWYSKRRKNMQNEIIRESMDQGLKNGIWSLIYENFFESSFNPYVRFREREDTLLMVKRIYFQLFKTPIDSFSNNIDGEYQNIRKFISKILLIGNGFWI